MTSFPETFVLNSRDIRSGSGETYGEMLLFVFGPPRAVSFLRVFRTRDW